MARSATFSAEPDAAVLLAQAEHATGLHDFGDGQFRAALEAFVRLPNRSGLGADHRRAAFGQMTQVLGWRLRLVEDRRDVATLVGLFVADVRMPGGEAGREALRKAFEAHLRADRVSILSVGGHVINLLDRDHAAGTVYSTAEFGDQGRWIRQAIAYEDDYERRQPGRAGRCGRSCGPGPSARR